MVLSPFLDQYLGKEKSLEINQLVHEISVLKVANEELKSKIQQLEENIPTDSVNNTYPIALKVDTNNDETKFIDDKGNTVDPMTPNATHVITGDSLINMIQEVSKDLSELTKRVTELETIKDGQ